MPSRYYRTDDPNPPRSGNGREDKPVTCVACQRRFSMLKGYEHRAETGHALRYKGQILKFGLPDAEMVKAKYGL